jgi:DNA-binding MarR family transcriptional regulator
MNSLRRITQAIRLSSSAAQKSLGITGAQLFVLQQLAEHPIASMREIVDRTLTDQSSVSVVVSRLVRSGYVARQRSESDARRIELRLTASGNALVRRAPQAAQARLVSALRGVPIVELRVAATVLERLAREMGASVEPTMFFEPGVTERKASKRHSKRGGIT